MKKIFFLVAVCVSLSIGKTFAQDYAYSQGSSTLSLGYGFANVWKWLFKVQASVSGGSYKVTALGPIGLVYEYGAAERISVGLAVGYSKVKGTYTDPSDATANYHESLSNISAIARANYHFGQSDRFDPYAGLGLGYYHFKYEYVDNSGTQNSTFALPTALGITGQLGAKYYVAPQFAIYGEVGYVGGSIIQLGITGKF